VHSRRSGVVHLAAAHDGEAIGYARSLVSLLSDQGKFSVETVAGRDLTGVLPESARRAYDVHLVTNKLLDDKGIELHPRWAPNIVTILGRLGGRTVGVIANNPMRLGGCLDSASAEKAARFVRFCDAFGVPLVVLVDVPGYLPGVGQEWDGVVRRGAKLLHAFAEATVARVTLVTRKSYGGAYIAMNSKSLGATKVYAWPEAEIAVMGAIAAVRVLHKRKLAAVPAHGASAPEYANGFDDSAWNQLKLKPNGAAGDLLLAEGQTAIFRAHVSLTEADLAQSSARIQFASIDDHGWVFVNNQPVGESTDWSASPAYDIKKALRPGDNVIAVGVLNESGKGGLNADVNVEVIGKPVAPAWSRSAFNGLAQVIVQSTKEPGEIQLTARADGLQSATATVTTQPAAPRPSLP